MKLQLPKLFKWSLRRFFILAFFSLFIAWVGFYLFFKEESFSFYLLAFFIGFSLCFFVFLALFARFFYALARVFLRVQNINSRKRNIHSAAESFWDEEPGEFYELNKNLNQIHNYLRWQKRIISQESSELEAVILALSGAILAIDPNKKVLFFNNQATLLFSSQRSFQRKELHLNQVIRNPDILQIYSECLKTGQIVKKTLSIGVFEADEESFIYEVTVAPFKKTGDRVQGAVGLFYDISNIRKAEQVQLDFITNVSHELRTPLTAIQGYVEALLEEPEKNDKGQVQQFLNVIRRNVQRLVSLLNHFLELSQMEEPLQIKKTELNTEEVTGSIIKDLHIKSHRLKLDFSQKTVKADRHFLKQILYNLIDNALKYSPKGRLIEVSWKKEKDFVVLKVKDQGAGISPRHRGRLFERFYRVDPSRTSVKGAGVGLSIVKRLMEKHGGSVQVESLLNKGSLFICSFPV